MMNMENRNMENKVKRLYRSRTNSVVAGICGGFGDYFDVDPVLVRVIVLCLVFSGVGLLAYLVGWIIIPMKP